MYQRRLIIISGIVQGVGFRPFIYQKAIQYSLSGWVNNDADGVTIDVQGVSEDLALFFEQITEHPPLLARIDSVDSSVLTPVPRSGFSIRHSHSEKDISVCITPDQALCADCLEDLRNPSSRYFRYPFVNCTNCGPRYTIVAQLPYDRCNTTMHQFDMCPECLHEYQDPRNRRYHAQPVSCHHCGPSVSLLGRKVDQVIAVKDEAIYMAARYLADGKVLAIKGIGGFHLVCDAVNADAVSRLRELKCRRLKPFAVMMGHESVARAYVSGHSMEWEALKSSAAPIVLMNRKVNKHLASEVSPVGPYLGVMLPYTPLHVLLFDALKALHATQVLVMTSANLSGLPLATHCSDIYTQFGASLDGILDHNRPIVHACDDSLVHFAGNKIRMLRMARGYAPLSVKTDYSGDTIVGMGAQQKVTLALATQEKWFLSPHIGDTDNLDTQIRYQKNLDDYTALYRCQVSRYVHDAHPGYFTSQLVRDGSLSGIPLQHHYAHVLSVMAEHQLTEAVLGFAFDGTGWGDDQTVWGGEVLLANMVGFQRCGHLRPFRLIGGEKAIREPARILFSMLLECYSPEDIAAMHHPAFQAWSESYFQNLYQLWLSGRNSPYCSSVGRLFDAWASLLGLIDFIDFEGESGLRIEAWARRVQTTDNCSDFPFHWTSEQLLDWESALCRCIKQRVWDQCEGRAVACQALIQSLVASICQMAEKYPSYPVVVCGGVFQNRLLLDLLWQQWPCDKQLLYSGESIPVNDGGIAAGQLWYGIHHQSGSG